MAGETAEKWDSHLILLIVDSVFLTDSSDLNETMMSFPDNDDLSSGAQNQCEASALSDCTVHHLVISGINLLSVCLIDHVCL